MEAICRDVIENSDPKLVKNYQNGKTKLLRAFLGKVAAQTNQRADMRQVDQIMRRLLDSNNLVYIFLTLGFSPISNINAQFSEFFWALGSLKRGEMQKKIFRKEYACDAF